MAYREVVKRLESPSCGTGEIVRVGGEFLVNVQGPKDLAPMTVGRYISYKVAVDSLQCNLYGVEDNADSHLNEW